MIRMKRIMAFYFYFKQTSNCNAKMLPNFIGQSQIKEALKYYHFYSIHLLIFL